MRKSSTQTIPLEVANRVSRLVCGVRTTAVPSVSVRLKGRPRVLRLQRKQGNLVAQSIMIYLLIKLIKENALPKIKFIISGANFAAPPSSGSPQRSPFRCHFRWEDGHAISLSWAPRMKFKMISGKFPVSGIACNYAETASCFCVSFNIIIFHRIHRICWSNRWRRKWRFYLGKTHRFHPKSPHR